MRIKKRTLYIRELRCLKCGLEFLESEFTSEDEQGNDICPACCGTDFEEIGCEERHAWYQL